MSFVLINTQSSNSKLNINLTGPTKWSGILLVNTNTFRKSIMGVNNLMADGVIDIIYGATMKYVRALDLSLSLCNYY